MNNFTLIARFSLLWLIMFMVASCGEKEQKAPPPPDIPVVNVLEQDVPIFQDFVGQVYGEVDIPIRARVIGFLEGIHFEEGRKVTKGQLLYTVDKQPYQAEVARQQSALAEARTSYTKATSDLNRIKPLAEINAVSQSDLDAAQAEYEAALAYVDAAEASVRLAKIELGYCYIKSPIDGIIGKTQAKVGEFVGQSPNPVILNTVSIIENVRVEFFLTENDYLKLSREVREARKERPQAEEDRTKLKLILSDGSIHPHKGHLDFINREVDQQTGSLLVQASFQNPEKILRPGQFARVRVELRTEDNAVLLPQKCLIELQGTFSVATVDENNEIKFKTVEVGPVYQDYWIIKSGIEPTDRVVLEGVQKVRGGMKVTPQLTTYKSEYSTELNK